MRAPPYSAQADELFSTASIEDPYPLFARLRRDRPLSRVPGTGVHLVASWALVEEALQREADFSAHLTGVLMRSARGEPSVFELPKNPSMQVIATADEPRHGVHRAIAQPRLAARQAPALEAPLRRWIRERLLPWLEDGAGDFVPLAEWIPARVVAAVLGLPEGDVSRFRVWAMIGGDMLAGDVDEARLRDLSEETQRMHAYLGHHLDGARPCREPAAPLLGALAAGVERGAIAREEAVGIATVMFGAGGESTAALLASAVRRLAEDPALAETLRRDSGLIPRFVEEVARLEPPFKFHYRVVRRDCELGGFSLRAGDRLMLLWASANRDETRVEDPDRLQLDRRHPKSHISFGRGSHFCIGAPLARLEVRLVCEELLAHTSELALSAEQPPCYAMSIFVRRHEQLAVCARVRAGPQ